MAAEDASLRQTLGDAFCDYDAEISRLAQEGLRDERWQLERYESVMAAHEAALHKQNDEDHEAFKEGQVLRQAAFQRQSDEDYENFQARQDQRVVALRQVSDEEYGNLQARLQQRKALFQQQSFQAYRRFQDEKQRRTARGLQCRDEAAAKLVRTIKRKLDSGEADTPAKRPRTEAKADAAQAGDIQTPSTADFGSLFSTPTTSFGPKNGGGITD